MEVSSEPSLEFSAIFWCCGALRKEKEGGGGEGERGEEEERGRGGEEKRGGRRKKGRGEARFYNRFFTDNYVQYRYIRIMLVHRTMRLQSDSLHVGIFDGTHGAGCYSHPCSS